MEENLLTRKGWVELDSTEAIRVKGGIGIGDIRHLFKLIGSLFNFAHEYYKDFQKGYENGWNLF